MANRREFLQIGIAASVLPIAARAEAVNVANNLSEFSSVSFYKAIFDSRYQDSQIFAQQMQQQDIPVHGIKGDITGFWFNELDAIWKQDSVAVAGMTAHGPLFCLEQLAWQHGMKVVYRAEHKPMAGNIIEHKLSAPSLLVEKSKSGKLALGGLDQQWPAGVARLMQECPQGHVAIEQGSLMQAVSGLSENDKSVDVFQDPLISWIIAPARKA